jgi:uncharacterized protein with GYD domain
MATYLTLFAYTGEAWARMITSPGDREEAARKLVEEMGGRLESFDWMIGDYDGAMVYEVPDEVTAAALLGAVHASTLIRELKTCQLVRAEDSGEALRRANAARRAYRPPGAPADWRAEYDVLGT